MPRASATITEHRHIEPSRPETAHLDEPPDKLPPAAAPVNPRGGNRPPRVWQKDREVPCAAGCRPGANAPGRHLPSSVPAAAEYTDGMPDVTQLLDAAA